MTSSKTSFLNWVNQSECRPLCVSECDRRQLSPRREFQYDVLNKQPVKLVRNGTRSRPDEPVLGAIFTNQPASNLRLKTTMSGLYELTPEQSAAIRSCPVFEPPELQASRLHLRLLKEFQLRALKSGDLTRAHTIQKRITRRRREFEVS